MSCECRPLPSACHPCICLQRFRFRPTEGGGAARGEAPPAAAPLLASNRRLSAVMGSSAACARGLLIAGVLTIICGVLAVTLRQPLYDFILDKVGSRSNGARLDWARSGQVALSLVR